MDEVWWAAYVCGDFVGVETTAAEAAKLGVAKYLVAAQADDGWGYPAELTLKAVTEAAAALLGDGRKVFLAAPRDKAPDGSWTASDAYDVDRGKLPDGTFWETPSGELYSVGLAFPGQVVSHSGGHAVVDRVPEGADYVPRDQSAEPMRRCLLWLAQHR